MSGRVFISYAHVDPDQGLARELRAQLERAGHDVFLDDEIAPGDRWSDDIDSEIRQANFFVVLLSSQSVTRDAVIAEVRRAHERARAKELRIIPLRVDFNETLPYELGANLEGFQFVTWNAGEAPERVTRTVVAAVNGEAQQRLTWDEIRAQSREQVNRFLRDAGGADQRRGVFRPELYVSRSEAEAQLRNYLSSETTALVLLGESGAGKTNLLCHWALEALEAGDAVFIFNCGRLADTDIAAAISDAVATQSYYGASLLRELEALARAQQRRCVFILDGLNEFCAAKSVPRDLWLAIDENLVRRFGRTGSHLRVAMSCSTSAWNVMTRRAPRIEPDPAQSEIHLHAFTEPELEAAYEHYREAFGLPEISRIPPEVHKQLLTPLLLRMFAEWVAGGGDAAGPGALENGFVAAYLERRAPREQDQFFIEDLARLMYEQKESVLAVRTVADDSRTGPISRQDDAGSSWWTLAESGVLTKEKRGNPPDEVVRFTFPTVNSHLLARSLGRIRAADKLRSALATLVDDAVDYPPAWEAAKTLLARAAPGKSLAPAQSAAAARRDDRRQILEIRALSEQVLVDFAAARDAEQREIVVATLAECHAADPAGVKRLMRRLLKVKSAEAPRTALKAAYCIGSEARDIFVEAAESGGSALREAVKDTLYLVWRNEAPAARAVTADTLYLIWRRNPGFTRDFLRELTARIGLLNVLLKLPLLKFFLQLSITIYINHCEKPEVVAQTAELYRTLATDALHLDTLNQNPMLARLIRRALVGAFSGPIVRSMFPAGLLSTQAFFELSAQQRAPLRSIAPYIDPAADLAAAQSELAQCLSSPNQIFALAAAVALSVHGYCDFARTEPLVRRLFEGLEPNGRLWVLFSFGVLLPDSPPQWRPLVEDLTRELCKTQRREIVARDLPLLQLFDFLFVPLGLACGKSGAPMSFVGELLTSALEDYDTDALVRWLEALKPLGFYYPETVLAEIRGAIQATDGAIEGWQPAAQAALGGLLATMRTLHLDVVDRFTEELGLDEGLGTTVAAQADVDAVHGYINWLGFYNNSVHLSVNYPWMRRELSIGLLTRMADATSARDFLADYADVANRMFHEAGYDLIRWTGPDPHVSSDPAVRLAPG